MKDRKYWLKGGLTVFLIAFVVLFLGVLVTNDISTFVSLFYFPGIWLAKAIRVDSLLFIPIAIIFGLAVYFFVGSIIGWIYGNLKNSN